jgi:uncharacterized membrane protein
MKRLLLPLLLMLAAVGLTVGELAYRYPKLPNRVASHFDAGGRADGWMSKRQFASTWLAATGILGFTFGMAAAVSWVVPAQALNLPRKEYWSAPQRTLLAKQMIVERLLWLAAATLLFVAYLSHQTLAFNLGGGGGQLTVWTPLGVFLAFTALWCGEFFWTFARAPRVDDKITR